MIELQSNDPRIRLLLPLYLRDIQEKLMRSANQKRDQTKQAWKSLRQANWLAEETARATSIQIVKEHLQKQGERWNDKTMQPRLHQLIQREIDEALHKEVEHSLRNAAKKVADELALEFPANFALDTSWVAQEQLVLARMFIHALVSWRRIDEFEGS